MLEQQLLEEFSLRLRAEIAEKRAELAPETMLADETALADVMLGYMEEAGLVTEHELCPYEDTAGRNRCRVVGYALPEDSGRLEIFTAQFVPDGGDTYLGADDLSRLAGRAARFFGYVAAHDLARFAGNDAAASAARYIADELKRVEDVRVHVLTNGLVRDRSVSTIEIADRTVEFSVVDLERLYRASRETVTRDRIEIDFTTLIGRPIACLEMKPRPKEYETYLVILPGELIFQLYEEFGARLFEFNVRSFLQAKGKVNKGLRDTLRNEPERFLAYNNGITATADEIEAGLFMGEMTISRIRGLQIVNGAQTTASIHRAKKADKIDISKVALAMKLTLVEPAKLTEFVPLIARYSNTQNVIQVSDLSANNEFHIGVEQLSEKVWCPGEEERWFYERARGAYQVAAARFGTTPARRREFDRECPKANRFSKTDLAKFLMSWWQRPQTVSRGAQKNFAIFMSELPERFAADWRPDEVFYKEVVALAILFRAAQSVIRRAKLQSYGANVLTFMIAKLSSDFGVQLDLPGIWESQNVSPELVRVFEDWAPRIHAAIITGAGRSNVTEWCKKDESWTYIKTLDLGLAEQAPVEIVTEAAEADDTPPPPHVNGEDLVGLCCGIDGAGWARVVAWGAENGRIAKFDQRVALTLASYALQGWQKKPSIKQARIGVRVLKTAVGAGVVSLT
ncbi:MAG TPA: AIPR family protein [Alphaproteobacteria bacterium]|nr:AIPR family protein [Alphaproteobacteria bacterium]